MDSTNFLAYCVLIVALVVWGTYWLFGSLLSAVLKVLLNRKDILYKGPRIISISNIAFRLKGNYRGLAMICVLAATTITAFGTSLSLRYYVDETHRIVSPYSFSWVSKDPAVNDMASQTIEDSEHAIQLHEKIDYLTIPPADFKDIKMAPFKIGVISYSAFSRITQDLKVENASELLGEINLTDKQAAYIIAPKTIGSGMSYEGKELIIGNSALIVTDCLKTPIFLSRTVQTSESFQ